MARGLDDRVLGVLGLEVVGRLAEVDPGLLRQLRGHHRPELLVRVDPRPHRRAADRQLAQGVQRPVQPLLGVVQLRGVPRELLAQPDGRRILQVRPPDLHDLVPRPGLRIELGGHGLDRRQQLVLDRHGRGDMHRGGEGVVGRTARR